MLFKWGKLLGLVIALFFAIYLIIIFDFMIRLK